MTWGRSAASSIPTIMLYRVVSPRRRTIISRIMSFTVHKLPFRSPFLEEVADPADNFRGARSVFYDSHGSRRAPLPHLGDPRVSQRKHVLALVTAAGNWLIHFVRQGRSEFSHGGRPADACKIRLRLAERFFSLLALDGDTREMGDSLYDILLLRTGAARLAVVGCEGPQYFPC